MKLYILTLKDGTTQEVLAFRVQQAFNVARCEIVMYKVRGKWEMGDV